jgi:hypothetical protein
VKLTDSSGLHCDDCQKVYDACVADAKYTFDKEMAAAEDFLDNVLRELSAAEEDHKRFVCDKLQSALLRKACYHGAEAVYGGLREGAYISFYLTVAALAAQYGSHILACKQAYSLCSQTWGYDEEGCECYGEKPPVSYW